MSKNCQNCRHFQWLPKPWSADQREAVWECKLGKDLEILDKMDTHISGVTWIGDAGRNTDLQCKLTARECDSYEGKNCQQCKHFYQDQGSDPQNPASYGPLDSTWACTIHQVEEILQVVDLVAYRPVHEFDTEEQQQRYFAKRCEEYNAESV